MQLKFLTLLLVCLAFSLNAQELKFPDLDKSPMDAAHYPRESAFVNYMTGDMANIQPKVKVLYCKPKKNDRDIFGALVPYGQDWRLGANEATEVIFYNDVEIGGSFVSRGTYTMFAEVYEDFWIIKVSSERFIGGSQNRDVTKDVARAVVKTSSTAKSRESFTIGFQKINEDQCHMVFEWDNTRAALPISFNPVYLGSDDASPMDLVQYPNMSRLRNYVKKEELAANEPQVRVVYARPQAKGRKIFGELLKYGEVWRVGANETTEITFFNDVKVAGNDIKAGKYGIMATPNADKWEIVLHTNIPSWGPNNHDASKNVAVFSVDVAKTPKTLEALSIIFDKKDDKNVHMIIGWENSMVRVPIAL